MASSRRHQPSYDFLAGESNSPPPGTSSRPASLIARPSSSSGLRQSLRASSISGLAESAIPQQPSAAAAAGSAKTVEDLRARIRKLEYEASSQKQAADMAALSAETELREAKTRAETEARKAREADRAAGDAARRADRLELEIKEREEGWEHEKQDSERRIRQGREQIISLEEEIEDMRARGEELERVAGRKKGEEDGRLKQTQIEYDRLLSEHEGLFTANKSTQHRFAKSEENVGRLEAEILELKSRVGDAEMVEVLKRDLGEQVGHIRRLETLNRTQIAELGELRSQKRSLEVVEEQKRSLETRLRLMDELRTELDEVRTRNEALENERKAWSSYFENETPNDPEMRFDSPEELARAFVRERVERVALMNQIGAIQPELIVKDDNIRALEEEKDALAAELNSLRDAKEPTTAESVPKAMTRLERQKNLAVKETEYLRAQLKALDAEVGESNPTEYNAEQAKRISQLENIVDQYRGEVSELQKAVTKLEENPHQESMPVLPSTPIRAGLKRVLDGSNVTGISPGSDERMGELLRKNRALQDNVSKLETRAKLLETDLKAKSSQLSSLKSSTRVRVLELKENPTAQAASVKKRELDTLKAENEILKDQVAGLLPTTSSDLSDALVPAASLTRLQLDMADREKTLASRDVSLHRLKEVFRAKGHEFKEAVASVLGWQLNFLPNGRVRATSMFYRNGLAYQAKASRKTRRRNEDEDDEAEENFIEFDGEKGTMKVSGGLQSPFAKEIGGLIEFWVDAKGQIPCFLAAMTLEFWEKYGEGRK